MKLDVTLSRLHGVALQAYSKNLLQKRTAIGESRLFRQLLPKYNTAGRPLESSLSGAPTRVASTGSPIAKVGA